MFVGSSHQYYSSRQLLEMENLEHHEILSAARRRVIELEAEVCTAHDDKAAGLQTIRDLQAENEVKRTPPSIAGV